MGVTVLAGDDMFSIRRRLTQLCPPGVTTERYDLTEPDTINAALAAVSTMSLFGPTRNVVLYGADTVTGDDAKRLIAALAAPAAVVVVVATAKSKLPTKVAGAAVERFTAPKANEVPTRIRKLAGEYGLKIAGQAAATLAARCSGDLDRVDQFFRGITAGGHTSVDEQLARELFADTTGDPGPWLLAERIEAGDVAGAYAMCARVDPHAFTTWFSTQLTDAARCAEAGATTPKAAAALLGVPDWLARRAATWARHGAAPVHEVRVALTATLLDLRSSTPHTPPMLLRRFVTAAAAATAH